MFKSLCQKSDELDYFDPSFATTTNSHSYFSGSASRVLREVNSAYGYVGKTYTAQNSWSFLTNYIGSYSWPVIVSFEPAELGGDFDYVGHAVVAFGYTVMNTDTFGSKATFKFVKVTDGWNQSPRYIAWDVIDYYEFPAIMVTFCPYQ